MAAGGVRGDFRGLEDLRRRLSAIGSGQLRREISKVCAEAAMKVTDDGFRRSIDPYGKPWTPLKSRKGRPLLDTGVHLRNSLAPRVTSSGFVISTAFKGAAVHQYGAVIRPVRAKALAFRTRGAPSARRPRGKLGPVVFAREVTIPMRRYMPEGDPGERMTSALNAAATQVIWQAMGRDY